MFQVKLVKQKDISEDRKCLFKQSENVSIEHGDSLDSPNYLIPPLKFDSTPRSRSQSVELPEALLGIPADQNRKLSLVNTEQPDANVHVMVQPPTPQVFVYPRTQKKDSNKDEGLAALMRSRAGQVPGKPSKQSWTNIRLGSPPAKKGSEVSFQYPSVTSIKVTQAEPNKDLSPGLGPAITITPMSELESDADTSTSSMATTTKGMTYLSPFTIITTCASRTASESNLSSSGYSSMASPGPSRSGSSNPLCISESEDTSTPTRSTAFFPKVLVPPMMGGSAMGGGGSIFIKRPHTLMKSPSADSESSDPIKVHPALSNAERRRQVMLALRYRTDSETTDEQCIPESISETHDSAVESAEDIIDEEEDEDKSPNTEAVPQINLEIQSSTESDKTVLSFKNKDENLSSAPNSPFSCSPRSSSHNLRQKLTLTLPEIVVEPCSPPATSPSAESSPTTFQVQGGVIKKDSCSSTTSSSSSLSLGKVFFYGELENFENVTHKVSLL